MKRLLSLVALVWLVGCSGDGTRTPVMDVQGEDLAADLTVDNSPLDWGPELCEPSCSGRECGDDGCGGSCGKCPQAAPVCNNGTCTIPCESDCEGKECGDDGCGASCGDCPAAAPYCVEFLCSVTCNIDCVDKECGDDGCGGSCGTCPTLFECIEGACHCETDCEGKECGADGCGGRCGTCGTDKPYCVDGVCQEDCTPSCEGVECGDDGCGGSCGVCDGTGQVCLDGACVCEPDCSDAECGSDGCGGSCGDCGCNESCLGGICEFLGCAEQECGPDDCGHECGECVAGAQCSEGRCLTVCDLNCLGKVCGDDGCGGTCGTCSASKVCTDDGECVTQCLPNCTGKVCGPNGCGGTCGTCATLAAPYCSNGQCVATCVPDCGGQACGPNGCGGSCGTCETPLLCTVAGTCGSNCSQCGFQEVCFDNNFADGNLAQFSTDGGTVVGNLGITYAPTGNYMLMLSTSGEQVDAGSTITLQDCLPSGSYLMGVNWKLYSEEFREFCGSSYLDSFEITLSTSAGNQVLAHYTIDDLCESSDCVTCGSHSNGLTDSDINFDQTDAWTTGWFEDWYPVAIPAGDSRFSVTLSAKDAGDGIYDTVVLVDRIRFVDCDSACDFIECGTNPCGSECGSCGDGGACISGTCCYPSCEGKECGSDGCGGNCGVCGTLSQCTDNQCECAWQGCSDGCCVQGDVCSTTSGKCCTPQCGPLSACQPNGCGGTCPSGTGAACCSTSAQCNDNDPCTTDACTSGLCSHTTVVSPECCEPLAFVEDFEDGQATGFAVENSGGIMPGLEAGWQVSNACGAHGGSYSLYFGMAQSLFGTCTYDMAFPPVPFASYGTATTPAMTLLSNQATISFWVQADIRSSSTVDTLTLQMLSPSGAVSLWSKANLPSVGTTWRSVSLPITGHAGETVQFVFSFNVVTASDTNALTGVRIDDLHVTSPCN